MGRGNRNEGVVEIKAGDLMKRVTLHVRVTGMRTLKIRLRIAILLMRLAAKVAGMGIQVEG